MKKLLMLVLIVLLIALSIFIGTKGFEIGNIQILSYTDIQTKNNEIDLRIQEASKLAEKDYKNIVKQLEESSKKLEQQKKEYDDMTAVGLESGVQSVSQIENYEIETLWVKLGNIATKEGVIIKIDVVAGSTTGVYNLNFTVNGSYISITDFISDIENESSLGFKIEEFRMLPEKENLQATFVCKDITINNVAETSNLENENLQSENNASSNADKTNTNVKADTNTNTTKKEDSKTNSSL